MLHSEYTRLRWTCAAVGLLLYVADILTDVGLAARYVVDGDLLWAGLTLLFVLTGALATQIFSYAWHRDDADKAEPEWDSSTVSGIPQSGLVGLHLIGMGILTRFYDLLRRGFWPVWSRSCEEEDEEDAAEEEKKKAGRRDLHLALFGLAADLSMLKMFETFLESAPQLLLQLYIMLEHNHSSLIQSLSLAASFANIAWSMVEYRTYLRVSLPHVAEMPPGLPTAVYLLYKLLTITARILSFSLLLTLTVHSAAGMVAIWLAGTAWAFWLQTDFCTSRKLEWLYRAVVGAVLTFSFFNVQGRRARAAMTAYYAFHALLGLAAPAMLGLLRPEVREAEFFWPVALVIVVGTVLGLFCLVVYYALLHPRRGKCRKADEVDGLEKEPSNTQRARRFLQP